MMSMVEVTAMAPPRTEDYDSRIRFRAFLEVSAMDL